MGKTVCEKTSLLPGSCAVSPQLLVGVSLLTCQPPATEKGSLCGLGLRSSGHVLQSTVTTGQARMTTDDGPLPVLPRLLGVQFHCPVPGALRWTDIRSTGSPHRGRAGPEARIPMSRHRHVTTTSPGSIRSCRMPCPRMRWGRTSGGGATSRARRTVHPDSRWASRCTSSTRAMWSCENAPGRHPPRPWTRRLPPAPARGPLGERGRDGRVRPGCGPRRGLTTRLTAPPMMSGPAVAVAFQRPASRRGRGRPGATRPVQR